MMSPRKKNALIFGALGLAALIYAGYSLRPQSLPLLPRATKIVDIQGKTPFYWWITDDALLRFRDPAKQDWTLVRYDLKTKTDTPLTALTELFQKSVGKPETLCISPDGDWVLWTGAGTLTTVSRLDGTHHYSVQTEPGENRWMTDEESWINIVERNGLFESTRIRSVDDGQKFHKTVLFPTTPSDPKAVDRARMAMTLDRHILVNYWDGAARQVSHIKVVFMGLGASLTMGGSKEFDAPRENLQGDIVFAPVTRQIAWALEFQEPLPEFLSGFSFSSKLPSRVSTGLWVMDADTKAVRALGALDTDHDDPTKQSGPYNIQWTPDEQHLSFIYNNALWTVPAL
jgi:hypothetical protein